ncbi:MAG: beta strand repeat-containing protein, partial [Burkholderiaceae bacterium]
ALTPSAADDAFTVNENDSVTGTVASNDHGVANETNTWAIATGPAHGTVAMNADGSYTYTPTAGYAGTDSFTYTITDANHQTTTATVAITVTPLHPTAGNDTATVAENGSVTGTVATNDTGVANETNTWAVATGPAHGTVAMNADGSYTYTPTAGYAGTDSFTYTITDANHQTTTATVAITVTPLQPAAANDTATVAENSSVTGTVATNDTGVANETNTWAVAAEPAHGTVAMNADGSYTYTPTAGYAGTDSFTYTITDSNHQTTTATVAITVTPLQPTAGNDTATVAENSSVTGTVATNDAGVAYETNTWAVATGPAHGTVAMNADGSYTYTPTAGYAGSDSFTYTITDANHQTTTATVAITVTPLQPTAGNDAATVAENGSVTGTVATNDAGVANETNTWAVASAPAHGSVTMTTDGHYTYTPTAGYAGTDSFTYTITDANHQTTTTTVAITVTPLQPAAGNDTATVAENSSVTGTVATNDTGVANETNTWAVTTGPAHGTVAMNADGSYTYTPTAGYAGTDSFTYTITDSNHQTTTASVAITVTPLQPTAADDMVSVKENASVSGTVAGNDAGVAHETNSWAVATGPSHGAVTMNADGTYTYAPTAGYAGTDSFTYTITDSNHQTTAATVHVTVVPVPLARNDAFATNEDTPLAGNLATNDTPAAGFTNTWTLDAAHGPAHGAVTVNANGTFTYTPAANYSGTDTFSYLVTDSNGDTTSATATVTINAVADAPTLSLSSHAFTAATDFEETPIPAGTTWADLPVSALGTGNSATSAGGAGVWQTDNAGTTKTVEIGMASVYGVTGDTSQVMEIEQNINDASNLYTTLNTRQGELYTLSFDFAARGNNGASSNSVVYVYWEGQLVDTLNNTSSAMQHYSIDVMATTTGSSTLEFVAGDSNSYGGIFDNVKFTLDQNTGVQGYVVNLPTIAAALTDTDGSESLSLSLHGLPVGAVLTDGTHSYTSTSTTAEANITGWNLSTLTMTPPASYAGDAALTVTATSTEGSNGSTASTTANVTLHVLSDAAGVYGTSAGDTLTISDAATTASSIRWGLDGDDKITGSIGHDTLVGGAGNDTLIAGSGATLLDGGTGNDSLVGGAGADTLSGGAGNDTMTGGGGVDVFKWHLGDQGAEGTPAADKITDFNSAAVTSGGDILDLRDLLVGGKAGGSNGVGNLASYLDFDTTSTPGSTVIHVSSHGDFTGSNVSAATDQTITLSGVNLPTALGLASNATDSQIISELLHRGKLVTDGQ